MSTSTPPPVDVHEKTRRSPAAICALISAPSPGASVTDISSERNGVGLLKSEPAAPVTPLAPAALVGSGSAAASGAR